MKCAPAIVTALEVLLRKEKTVYLSPPSLKMETSYFGRIHTTIWLMPGSATTVFQFHHR